MSHEPIGPRGPLRQSVDLVRHSLMADRSSSLVPGLHAVSMRRNSGSAVRFEGRLEVRLDAGISKMKKTRGNARI